jgi:esterase
LVHGFLDEASLWDSAIERLDADRYRCIAIDLPGMGTRADDAGPYDLARLTGAVLDAIDGVTAPVIIVGHSMGAQVAERAAVARPDAVAAIVLLTPVVLRCRRR